LKDHLAKPQGNSLLLRLADKGQSSTAAEYVSDEQTESNQGIILTQTHPHLGRLLERVSFLFAESLKFLAFLETGPSSLQYGTSGQPSMWILESILI
jgi:hypothetical protein